MKKTFVSLPVIALAAVLFLGASLAHATPGPGNCPSTAKCDPLEHYQENGLDCSRCTVKGDDNQSYTGQACGGTQKARDEGARKNAVRACNTPPVTPNPRRENQNNSSDNNRSVDGSDDGFIFDGVHYKK